MNSGPGGVAGAFVHRRHINDQNLPKFLGWWGTNPATRFKMDNVFDAMPTVESWQLSNTPIFQMAALRASLELFDEAGGMGPLRAKSEKQIRFFDRRLGESLGDRVKNLSPTDMTARGCQFALQVMSGNGRAVFEQLERERVFCDWREPDVIRVAPVPLYNSFDDIDRFVQILDRIVP